jgi:hypothetical protein
VIAGFGDVTRGLAGRACVDSGIMGAAASPQIPATRERRSKAVMERAFCVMRLAQ